MSLFRLFKRGAAPQRLQAPAPVTGLNLILWLLILPLALFGVGLWEEQRAADSLTRDQQDIVSLHQNLDRLKQLAASDPSAMVTFGHSDQDGVSSFSALVAEGRLEGAVSETQNSLNMSYIRRPIPWFTIGGAALAFLSGGLGLLAAKAAGFRARKSRQQLVRSFRRLRLLLPFVLALLVIGFSLGVIGALLFEALGLVVWDEISSGSAKLFMAGLALAGISLYSAFMGIRGLRHVFALFTPEPLDISGRVVDAAAAPGLWQFVRDLAARQQALLPDTIIVGLDDGFFVTEGGVRLWPEDRLISGRTLYLPAPYLELLDMAEISAIVGHEFAHFAGEDTVYSQRFSPIYASLWRALAALRQAESGTFVLRPAVQLGYHAIENFNFAVAHWSRVRELDADRNGSVVSGPAGAASALIRTGLIGPAVRHVLDGAFKAPGEVQRDLVTEVAVLVGEQGFIDPLQHLEERQPHPTDSHPPTAQRVAALGISVDSIIEHAKRPPDIQLATAPQRLFADWAGLCQGLTADFLANASKHHARRREALETAVSAVSMEATTVYDNVWPIIGTMIFVAVIMAGFTVAVFVYGGQIGFSPDDLAHQIVAGVAGLGGVCALLYAAILYGRRNTPLMVLTPDTLITPRLTSPVAWDDIADFGIYANQRFALRLLMRREATLPGRRWYALYTKVDRGQRMVTIGALGIRGMKAKAFAELVGRYHYAAYARRELAAGRTPAA